MNSPPRKGQGAPASTPKPTRLLRQYLVSLALQPGARRCLGCGVCINNRNLGGHARKAALAGRLWCLRCADVGGCR
jgi:hypothetical protein